MKLTSRTLFFFAFATTSVLALAPVRQLAGEGEWMKKHYGVCVGDVEHVRAGKLDPEKEEAPLSSKRAVALARAALKKMVGDAAAMFQCEEVRLTPDWASRGDYWFWVVRFWSDDPSLVTREEDRTILASLPFIVYFDGFVEPPKPQQETTR